MSEQANLKTSKKQEGEEVIVATDTDCKDSFWNCTRRRGWLPDPCPGLS